MVRVKTALSSEPMQMPSATLMQAVATWLAVSDPMANETAASSVALLPGVWAVAAFQVTFAVTVPEAEGELAKVQL